MKRTFFDQWHRISSLRVGLRPGIVARLHPDGPEPWYVLHQPSHAGYFRLSPGSYRFVCQLNPSCTVDQSWRKAVEEIPELAPGQEETYELLSALYRNNLLYVEGGVDDLKLVQRHLQKKKKPLANRLAELLFMRIPLWDPEPWLKRHQAFFAWLWQWPLGCLVGTVLVWALLEFFLAGPRVWSQAQDILQLGNLLPLYLAIFVTHLFHEMAHAIACKHFGGQVRTMGVMLLMFTPLPYVDLSSSWTFRDRFKRAWVGSAGMASDLFVGAVATIVWAYSPPGMLNELAYNLMFSTAIYTFLFNINPLMRFDGYYVLSDLVGVPNLHEAAKEQFKRWWGKVVLGQLTDSLQEYVSVQRQWGLSLFYVTSNVYRWAVMLGIVLFVADQYWGIGLVVGIALIYSTFLLPMKTLWQPLRNPVFVSQQKRKIRMATLALVLLLGAFLWLPLPESRALRGVVEASQNTALFAQSSARVVKVHASSGQWVEAGQLLVELENPELLEELRAVDAQLLQTQAQERKAIFEGSVDLAPLQIKLATLMQAQAHFQYQRTALRIVAPHQGYWTSQDMRHLAGSWVARGKEIGSVVDERQHVFLGVVGQAVALNLDALNAADAHVRVEGERELEHQVSRLTVVPHSQKNLPSVALTPLAGGDLAVSAKDQSGRQALEQFFLIRAALKDTPREESVYLNGRSGWIRLQLPARPLAPRVLESVQQFFQRRYQV
jgi:putative peptide zinc metalloprotease protein